MAAWRDRPVAAWGIPAIPVAAKLGRTPMPAAAAKFCKGYTNKNEKCEKWNINDFVAF